MTTQNPPRTILRVSISACLVAVALTFLTQMQRSDASGSSCCPQDPVLTATCIGDVNGDGGFDISDPVYMLGYIFGNGPAPAANALAEQATPSTFIDLRASTPGASGFQVVGSFPMPVELGNELSDTLGEYDTVTNTFTPLESGRYLFTATVTTNQPSVPGDDIILELRRDPISYAIASSNVSAASGSAYTQNQLTRILDLQAGESIVLMAKAAQGSTKVLPWFNLTSMQIQRMK